MNRLTTACMFGFVTLFLWGLASQPAHVLSASELEGIKGAVNDKECLQDRGLDCTTANFGTPCFGGNPPVFCFVCQEETDTEDLCLTKVDENCEIIGGTDCDGVELGTCQGGVCVSNGQVLGPNCDQVDHCDP